jgi:hypothetical protein
VAQMGVERFKGLVAVWALVVLLFWHCCMEFVGARGWGEEREVGRPSSQVDADYPSPRNITWSGFPDHVILASWTSLRLALLDVLAHRAHLKICD